MIYGFMHVYAVGNWKEIVVRQLREIERSLLGVWMETLYVGINGPPEADRWAVLQHPKIEVLYCIDKPEIEQSLTLSFIRNFVSRQEDNLKIFYIHTKGVTHNGSRAQEDWRTLMEYYTITRFKDCLGELEDGTDIVGTNWHLGGNYMSASPKKCGGEDVTPHFSGNFWWANSDYLRSLPKLYPLVSKYQCEFWIGKGCPYVAELWKSGVHHHRSPYPKEKYEGKIDVHYYHGGNPVSD